MRAVLFIISTLAVFSAHGFSTQLAGNWSDELGNNYKLKQIDSLISVFNKSNTHLGGKISTDTLTLYLGMEKIYGIISANHRKITWSNNNVWYKSLTGSWKSTKSDSIFSITQKGNLVKIQDANGKKVFVGFTNDEGISSISNSRWGSASNKENETKLNWVSGEIWVKQD